MQLRRVVITGLGAVTPLGNSAQETWQGLVNGVNGIAPITAFDATNFKTRFAGEVKGFDPTAVIDKKEARKMDRYAQCSVCVADEALKDSGLDLEKEDRSRVGEVHSEYRSRSDLHSFRIGWFEFLCQHSLLFVISRRVVCVRPDPSGSCGGAADRWCRSGSDASDNRWI